MNLFEKLENYSKLIEFYKDITNFTTPYDPCGVKDDRWQKHLTGFCYNVPKFIVGMEDHMFNCFPELYDEAPKSRWPENTGFWFSPDDRLSRLNLLKKVASKVRVEIYKEAIYTYAGLNREGMEAFGYKDRYNICYYLLLKYRADVQRTKDNLPELYELYELAPTEENEWTSWGYFWHPSDRGSRLKLLVKCLEAALTTYNSL